MKKILLSLCSAALCLLACTDVEDLKERVDDLEDRVTYLEELCTELNANVLTMQAFVNAHVNDLYVRNVEKVTDGFIITFSDGQSYSLKNGEKGNKGEIGPEGPQGPVGATPDITIIKDAEDGQYYWGIGTEYILVGGEKVSAIGVTPRLKIEDDQWKISYDEGVTWTVVAPAYDTASKIDITQDEDAVYFTQNGTTIAIAKVPGFAFLMERVKDITIAAGGTVEIAYTLKEGDESVCFDVRGQGGYTAVVTPADTKGGKVTITAPSPIADGHVIITAIKNSTSEVKAQYISFDAGVLTLVSTAHSIDAKGGTVQVVFDTNLEYDVKIPVDCDWITYTPTKAVSRETVDLTVAANNADARSAQVEIAPKDGSEPLKVLISQEAVPVAAFFSVTPVTLDVEGAATSAKFSIAANVDWTVTAPAGVTADVTSGSASSDVNLTFEANATSEAKVYEITVATSSADITEKTITVTLTQAKYKNPNDFTYVLWGVEGGFTGNNMGLTPVEKYGNQIRVVSTDGQITLKPVKSDIPDGATVTYANTQAGNFTSWKRTNASSQNDGISGWSAADGSFKLKFTSTPGVPRVHVATVLVTVSGLGPDPVSKVIPIFIDQCNYNAGGYMIKYTPFVLRVNPKTGGELPGPEITRNDAAEFSNFTLDTRRNINYFNLNGPLAHTPSTSQYRIDQQGDAHFLSTLWNGYFTAIGKANNYSSCAPVSYFNENNAANKRLNLCGYYVDNANGLKVVVNPDKFKDADGVYGDGVVIGTCQYNIDGINPISTSLGEVYPFAIWLDTSYTE